MEQRIEQMADMIRNECSGTAKLSGEKREIDMPCPPSTSCPVLFCRVRFQSLVVVMSPFSLSHGQWTKGAGQSVVDRVTLQGPWTALWVNMYWRLGEDPLFFFFWKQISGTISNPENNDSKSTIGPVTNSFLYEGTAQDARFASSPAPLTPTSNLLWASMREISFCQRHLLPLSTEPPALYCHTKPCCQKGADDILWSRRISLVRWPMGSVFSNTCTFMSGL